MAYFPGLGLVNPWLASTGVGILFLAISVYRWSFSSLRDVPGPGLASVTRWWHVWHILKGDINLRSIELHERHGHFVRIAPEEVSVSHPDAVRAILVNTIPKAPWYAVLALPDKRYQTAMSITDPKQKNERSKPLAAAYSTSHLIKSEAHIDDTIGMFLKRINQLVDQGKEVDLARWFNYLTFDILGEAVFSKRFGFLEKGEDLGGSIANSRYLNAYITAAGYFQSFHFATLGNPLMSKYGLMPANHLLDTTTRALKDRSENLDARVDMVEQWQRGVAEQKIARIELTATTNSVVGAGADTVSCGLQSFVYHLIRSPNHYTRCREEIDAAKAQGLLSGRIVSFADAQKLPYLQACIKEALRMFGPVPFGLAREVPDEGIKVGNRFFPKGVKLSVNPWVIHMSKELFGSDAKAFNPDRWLEPRAKEADKYFMPFGAGYNSCPGRNLAMIELSKITATLMRDYDINLVNPKEEWKWKAYFTVVPYGWPCDMKRRD